MDAEITPPPQRIARKLNRRIALSQARRGFNQSEIARQQGVDQSTVNRFMAKMAPEIHGVALFKVHRADTLARLQAKSHQLQEEIMDSLNRDGIIASLKAGEKTGLLMALNATAGTLFDKERLERGQSTSNQSIITSMLNTTVKTLYVETPAKKKYPGKRTPLPVDE